LARSGRGDPDMGYIDAGYAAALGSLFVYAISLFARRHRLQRLEARVSERREQRPR
jgi:hypothetical protein